MAWCSVKTAQDNFTFASRYMFISSFLTADFIAFSALQWWQKTCVLLS